MTKLDEAIRLLEDSKLELASGNLWYAADDVTRALAALRKHAGELAALSAELRTADVDRRYLAF